MIHQNGILTVSAVWLLLSWCHMNLLPPWCTFCIHHINHAPVYSFIWYTQGVCMFSNLPPALLANGWALFTCYCGNRGGPNTEVWVNTESWPQGRKICCSSQDSIPWLSDHKSGTLPAPQSKTLKKRIVLLVFPLAKQFSWSSGLPLVSVLRGTHCYNF